MVPLELFYLHLPLPFILQAFYPRCYLPPCTEDHVSQDGGKTVAQKCGILGQPCLLAAERLLHLPLQVVDPLDPMVVLNQDLVPPTLQYHAYRPIYPACEEAKKRALPM